MSSTPKSENKLSALFLNFFCGGSAACVAEIASLPLDTTKVRMQLQGREGAAKKYRNMFHGIAVIAREEGPTALWKGLVPGLLRQMVFASLRIGLYQPVREFYHKGPGEAPLYKKILAGLTTGSIGISIANPTDLVKIRLQAEGKLAPGVPRRYNGTADAFAKIYRSEGIVGFWKGVGPNIIRNSIINAAELATYDQAKQSILNNGILKEGLALHFASAITAGFMATLVGSPADVLKTRIMNQKIGPDGVPTEYRNAFHAIVKISKTEGFSGWYKGFWPNFSRIGSWNIVMFLTYEKVRNLVGLGKF